MGIGMALFGLVMLPAFGLFGLVWLVAVLGVIGYHAMNLFSEEGVATEVVDFETSPGAVMGSGALTPEQRLARLDDMRQKGLVDEQEYAEQRRRILNSI
jgi:hypothetical protein